jgi:radical SAM superfamily enzyme YgiQ (UPF0313 family)
MKSITRVLLVNPICSPIYGPGAKSEGVTMPLGMAYIASYLRKNNVESFIIDAEAESLSWTQLKERIRTINPHIIGIYSTTPTIYLVHKTAEIAKSIDKSIKVVLGGPHATVMPEDCLKNTHTDFCIIGEGEYTFLELVKGLKKGKSLNKINGIAFKKGTKVIKNNPGELIQDLDSLPFPARDLLKLNKYVCPTTKALVLGKGYGGEYTDIITSRGCPYRCTYCSSQVTFGHRIRYRSPESVIAEIEEVIKNYGIKTFNILDDTFTADKNRIIKICDLIIKRKLKIQWICQSRVNLLSRKIAVAMKKAGCKLIAFGIESGNQQILNNIKKGITLEQAKNAVKICKDVGLATLCAFMVGNPGETRKTAIQTIKFAIKLNPTFANFFITTPYPGTELYEWAKSKGLIKASEWSKYIVIPSGLPPVTLSSLSKKELKYFNKLAYKKFYLRPRYVFARIFELNSFEALKQALRGFKTLLNF